MQSRQGVLLVALVSSAFAGLVPHQQPLHPAFLATGSSLHTAQSQALTGARTGVHLKQAGTAVGGDDAALLVKAIGGNMAEMMKAQQEMMFSGSSPAKSKAEEELAGILWLEHDLKSQLYDMQEAAYEAKIASDQLLVANETSAGVANMLGEMRREMHEFGAPFYRKVL